MTLPKKFEVVALTGAGISSSAGIPTFESTQWKGNPIRDYLTRDFANSKPEEFDELMSLARETCTKAIPTRAHRALASTGIPIITQNVDGLHQKAGSTIVYEPHGNIFTGVVLYGDPLKNDFNELVYLVIHAKDLLVIGTSLFSQPIASLPAFAERKGVNVIYINEDADRKVLQSLKNLGLLINGMED